VLSALALASERLLEWFHDVKRRPGITDGRHGFDLRLFNADSRPVVDVLAYVELKFAQSAPASWTVTAQWNGVQWELEASVARQKNGEEERLFSTGVEHGATAEEFVTTLRRVVDQLVAVQPLSIASQPGDG